MHFKCCFNRFRPFLVLQSADVKDGRYWFKTQDSLDGVMLPVSLNRVNDGCSRSNVL